MDRIFSVSDEQKKLADDFYNLHHSSAPFILPNAWDAVSVKIFELEGFQAIGTTSAGIASTLGYGDGEKMRWSDNLDVSQRITRNTNLPVSVDIEAGYSESIDGLVKNVDVVIGIGAVGINLEDSHCYNDNSLFSVPEQAEKLSAVRELAESKNIKLFINARTDVFLTANDSHSKKIDDTINRANEYVRAGADCIFVPDMGDLDTASIRTLAAEINSPLNILAGANTPAIRELAELGVARVSLGPRPMRATFDLLRSISRELLDHGTYGQIMNSSTTYSEVNSWFK